MIHARRLFLIIFLSFTLTTPLLATESTDQTIAYLFNYIATSKAVFIRNDVAYTPEQALKHIRAKYEHYKTDIKTPEDFIRLCASKSLVTNQWYQVKPPGQPQVLFNDWLRAALKAHRAKTGG
ncbi:MAG: hypothetical protein QOI04_303 [Verrucomicrobiota bacterium]|jgi:hypothetical protein